jgi:hypothetical protein
MAAMAAAADDYYTTGALSSFAGEPSVFLLRRHHDRDTTARTECDGRRGSEKKRNRWPRPRAAKRRTWMPRAQADLVRTGWDVCGNSGLDAVGRCAFFK